MRFKNKMSLEYDLNESLSIFRQYGLTKKSSGLNQLVVRFNKPRLNAEINISAATRTSEGVLFNVRIEYQIKLFASFNKEMIDCGFQYRLNRLLVLIHSASLWAESTQKLPYVQQLSSQGSPCLFITSR